jgi:hypothetical protein
VKTRSALVPLVLALLGAVAALGTAAGATPAAPSAVQPSALTPEDVLAATLRPGDVHRFLPHGASWWSMLPEFNDGGFDPAPGKRFWVVQSYELVAGGRVAGPHIQAPLTLYATEADAARDFAAMAKTKDASGTPASGPGVGDESRYLTRPADDKLIEAALRFRVGPVLGRVSVFDSRPSATASLARYAAPVVARVRALLAGTLKGTAIPADLARRLPPTFADLPVAGSAVVPAEDWAVVDDSGQPEKVRALLRRNGAGSLAFRRYDVGSSDGQVIEVTLFPFASGKAATTWAHRFLAEVGDGGLDPGRTGPLSAFTSNGGKFYELQFAEGRFVADISCFAPFGETSRACEWRVRTLGQLWYPILAGA